MNLPFVILPRSVYDDMRADTVALRDQVFALKKDGYSGRIAQPGRMHIPGAPPEELALAAAEAEVTASMVADFMRNGLSKRDAEAEARRIAVTLNATAIPIH